MVSHLPASSSLLPLPVVRGRLCIAMAAAAGSSVWLLLLPPHNSLLPPSSSSSPPLSACPPLVYNNKTATAAGRGGNRTCCSASSSSFSVVTKDDADASSEPATRMFLSYKDDPNFRGCKGCGRDEPEPGCNGEGRIQGGIAAVPGFGWWPIKAYRPCPGFLASGGRYRRQGQSMDDVASGTARPKKSSSSSTTTTNNNNKSAK